MNGIDERDLAQVSGGDDAEANEAAREWKKRNCDICAKKPGCGEKSKLVESVLLAARDGRPIRECTWRE